jgi:putative transposon-encoded protein
MQKLSEDFIDQVFLAALLDRNFFLFCVPHLKDQFLVNEDYQILWGAIKKENFKKGRVPSIAFLIQHFDSNNKKGRYDKVIETLRFYKHQDLPDMAEVREGFQYFVRQSSFVDFQNILIDLWNKDKKDEAFKRFVDFAEEFQNLTLDDVGFVKVFADFDKRMVRRAVEENRAIQIPTGMTFFDETTEGGAFTGETELWLGDSGVGKSKLLTTRGIASARRGFGVLHVQAEGTEEQALLNYDACWTGWRYSDLKFNRVEAQHIAVRSKVAREVIMKKRGEVMVKAVEQFGSSSMVDVHRWCMKAKQELETFEHLILDYLELFEPGDGLNYDYKGGTTVKLKKNGRLFKNLAMEFNLLATTVAQSSSVSPELQNQIDFYMTRHNIGESRRLIEAFSYFLTINQTSDEKEAEIARIYQDKMREHKPIQRLATIAQNLGRSRFFDRKRSKNLNLTGAGGSNNYWGDDNE